MSLGKTGDQKRLRFFFLFPLMFKIAMSALALKILSEGNMGDHKKLRVVSLSTYVWNCCVMKILYGRRRWK